MIMEFTLFLLSAITLIYLLSTKIVFIYCSSVIKTMDEKIILEQIYNKRPIFFQLNISVYKFNKVDRNFGYEILALGYISNQEIIIAL